MENKSDENKPKNQSFPYIPVIMVMGMSIGTVLGAVFGKVGIAFGTSIGIIIGVALDQLSKKKDD